jgi:hypothetical protein
LRLNRRSTAGVYHSKHPREADVGFEGFGGVVEAMRGIILVAQFDPSVGQVPCTFTVGALRGLSRAEALNELQFVLELEALPGANYLPVGVQ